MNSVTICAIVHAYGLSERQMHALISTLHERGFDGRVMINEFEGQATVCQSPLSTDEVQKRPYLHFFSTENCNDLHGLIMDLQGKKLGAIIYHIKADSHGVT